MRRFDLEKIGDFSRRCEVTIKALRHYDKLGLLVPDYIDKFTGYRYYGPEKVAEMRRVTELKAIGFSLEEIKKFCLADTDAAKCLSIQKMRQKLEKLAADAMQQLEELNAIEQTLNLGEKGSKKMDNNFNMPFVNDEAVIGRWEFADGKASPFEEIYFLPNGGSYWIFSWTKGYIKISSSDGNMLCPYELKDGMMYAKYGEDTWALKQMDSKHYTKRQIGKNDNIDLPFENDPNVVGKWVSVDFVKEIGDFSIYRKYWQEPLFFKTIEFFPDGHAEQFVGENGRPWHIRWTKGTTLIQNGDGTFAPAYEIYLFGETEYLFVEWKSGDYIWGKRKPYYYVFKRG
jgi:DNA-binding transcriptional MerR regulator